MTSLSQILGWRAFVGAVGALATPLLFGAAVLGPQAPAALERADRLAMDGELNKALALYTAIEDQTWSPERAATAAWHAGSAAALAGRDQDAIAHLETFLQRWPQDERAPAAAAQLGVLLAESNPKGAADALVLAADSAPESPNAPQHMLEAARLLEKSGETTAAWSLYERTVRSFPQVGPSAQLAMARMRLQVGDPGSAQELYEQVLRESSDAATQEIARLGLSIAQEDLGDFDAVLADLNELDMSDAQREQRRDRVMGRVSKH